MRSQQKQRRGANTYKVNAKAQMDANFTPARGEQPTSSRRFGVILLTRTMQIPHSLKLKYLKFATNFACFVVTAYQHSLPEVQIDCRCMWTPRALRYRS